MLRLITVYFAVLCALMWAIGAFAIAPPPLGFLLALIGVGSIALMALTRWLR